MKLKSAASAIRGLLVLAITATAFIGLSASPAEAVTVEGGCGANHCYRQWRAGNGQIVDYAAIGRNPTTGRITTRSCDYNNDGTTLGVRYDPSDGGSRTVVHAAPGTLSDPCSDHTVGYSRLRKFRFVSAVQVNPFPNIRVTGSTAWRVPPWGQGPP